MCIYAAMHASSKRAHIMFIHRCDAKKRFAAAMLRDRSHRARMLWIPKICRKTHTPHSIYSQCASHKLQSNLYVVKRITITGDRAEPLHALKRIANTLGGNFTLYIIFTA